MESSKKILLSTIGIAVVIVVLVGVTFAFFNYTRTGSSNVVKVGRISFNSEQGNSINLDNVFPIARSELSNNSDYVGSTTIHITGNTDYSEGIEYLVSVVDVNNATDNSYSAKRLPIGVDVSYAATNNKTIGTNDKYYFDNRGGNTSLYKVLAGDLIYDNANLAVGYIAPGSNDIDGTITIKAFIDKDKIAITDTKAYPYSSNDHYGLNNHLTEEELTKCVNKVKERFTSLTDEVYESYCQGIGTISGNTFSDHLKYASSYYNSTYLNYFTTNNIIYLYTDETSNDWINNRTLFTTDEWNNLSSLNISFKIKVEANEGTWVTVQGNSMWSDDNTPTPFASNISNNIKAIYFNNMSESDMLEAYNEATYKADLTYNNEGKVLAYLVPDTEDNTKYIMYIVSDGKTDFPENSRDLFENLYINNAEIIEFNNVNTAKVVDMSDMFSYCHNVKRLDLTSFDTSNVTNMNYMFYAADELEYINMSGLDMRKVTTTQSMFSGCGKLKEAYFTNSKTRDITSMYYMFSSSQYLETVNMDGLGGNNLTNIDYMFPSSIKNISMKNFNFGRVAMNSKFNNLTNLETIDLSGATINSPTLSGLFSGNNNLVTVNLENAKITGATTTSDMFYGCSSLTSVDLSGMDFSTVTNTSNMFNNCSSLTTIKVANNFDISNVTGSNNMFYGCTSLVGGNGTTYDEDHVDKEYAIIDGTNNLPGYFTLKTN